MIVLRPLDQLRNLYAVWKFDVREIQHRVKLKLCDIDFEIFRKVFRQTSDFDIIDKVSNLSATVLYARGNIFTHEVQRHIHLDLFVFNDALKIHVHDEIFCGMTLQVLENRGLAFFIHLDTQDARIERFILELFQDLVLVK